jgi:hypothetical protein
MTVNRTLVLAVDDRAHGQQDRLAADHQHAGAGDLAHFVIGGDFGDERVVRRHFPQGKIFGQFDRFSGFIVEGAAPDDLSGLVEINQQPEVIVAKVMSVRFPLMYESLPFSRKSTVSFQAAQSWHWVSMYLISLSMAKTARFRLSSASDCSSS